MIYEGPGIRIQTDTTGRVVAIDTPTALPVPSPAPPSTTQEQEHGQQGS